MEPNDLEARRARLRKAIDAHEAQKRAEEERDRGQGTMAGIGAALRLSTEFVSGVVVGGVLGYLFDWGLGTTPWGMIIFLLLGFAAGVLNVLRSAGLIQSPQVGKRPPDGG
jgi:ATP synthase protein I